MVTGVQRAVAKKVVSFKTALPLMPVDCSMTNWFYNSIKARRAGEGGGDKQGSGGSSLCGGESLGQIPEWERLPQARADLARW